MRRAARAWWLLGLLVGAGCRQSECEVTPDLPLCAAIVVQSQRLSLAGDTLVIRVPAPLAGSALTIALSQGSKAVMLPSATVGGDGLLKVGVGPDSLGSLTKGPVTVTVSQGELTSRGTATLWRPPSFAALSLGGECAVASERVSVAASGPAGIYLSLPAKPWLRRCGYLPGQPWLAAVPAPELLVSMGVPLRCATLKVGPLCYDAAQPTLQTCPPSLQACAPLTFMALTKGATQLTTASAGDLLLLRAADALSAWALPEQSPLSGLPASTTGIAVAMNDLNGDGRSDLALISSAGKATVYVQDGRGGVAQDAERSAALSAVLPQLLPDPLTDEVVVSLRDLDGDGSADLIVAQGRTLRWAVGQPDGTFFYYDKQAVDLRPLEHAQDIGDLAGDGQLTVVGRDAGNKPVVQQGRP